MESLGSTCTNESLRTERALKELDKNDGTALSCVSSGGILMKHDGRVGHSAQFGCAIWSTQVGDQSVSVSTSGCGEAIVRTHLAKTIAEDLLSSPRDRLPVEIVVDTVRRKFLHSPLLEIYPHERRLAGGLVMLKDADGMELVIFHNTQHFAFAYSDGKVVKHHISKLPPGADVICATMQPFQIPSRDDDLLELSVDSYYVAELKEDIKEIMRGVKSFRKQVEKDNPESIFEHFDFFFALARPNDANTLKSLLEAFDTLITAFEAFLPVLKDHLKQVVNSDGADDQMKETSDKYANMLLMYCYLLARVSFHIETEVIRRFRNMNATQKSRKGNATNTDDDGVNQWGSINGRMRMLKALFSLITTDAIQEEPAKVHKAGVKFLWKPPILPKPLIGWD
ncbi:Asparaginase family protein [Aphelenchoides avenae]|nr:Asparaginase family protein [Aphelenchus avenae]